MGKLIEVFKKHSIHSERASIMGSILEVGAYTGALTNPAQMLVTACLGTLPPTLTELWNRKDAIKNENWYFYWQLRKS